MSGARTDDPTDGAGSSHDQIVGLWADDGVSDGADAPDPAADPPGSVTDAPTTPGPRAGGGASAGRDIGREDSGEGDIDAEPSLESMFESTLADLEQVTAQRDEYLDMARRVQADFENYKRRIEAQRAEQAARAAEQLVVELLPVLDACELAVAHDAEGVGPIASLVESTLTRLGLDKVDTAGVAFDPNVHEAVLSEPAGTDDDQDGPVVAEVMRSGYSWKGRIVRPAMVKVRGS